MEKTELEKKWDAEVEEAVEVLRENEEVSQGCGGDCKCNKSNDLIQGYDEEDDEENEFGEDEIDCILSPLSTVDIPLVLITNNNRIFLGGLLDVVGGGVLLDLPMVYMEMADPRTPGKLQVGVQKIYHGLSIPNSMWFRHDTLNMLKLEERSKKLAEMYANTFNEIRMQESGLTMPSPSDLMKINKNG